MTFKAIELELVSRRRTGRELAFDVETRQLAIVELLRSLGIDEGRARIDPTRTLIQVESHLWTIVGSSAVAAEAESSSLRRGGAKHKRVR